VDAHPILTREQERDLFLRYADGDEDARETILLSNVRLVVKVCGRYLLDGMALEDLVQEGMVGLMTAVEKFEVERGLKFSTYATWWIRQSVQRTSWQSRHPVHVPIGHSTTLNRVRRAWQELIQQLGEEPTDEEIAERLDMDPAEVAALTTLSMTSRSLDAPMRESSTDSDALDIKSSLPDDREEHPLEWLSRDEEVARALRVLSPKHRELLERRYGLRDPREEALTYREVVDVFGVTHQRLHQMETQAFAAVRRMFPRERNDQAPSNIHAVDEARDSETVEPSPQDEPQLSLFQ
jgi:RNA polymerase sigma factor (sigma-70 family)